MRFALAGCAGNVAGSNRDSQDHPTQSASKEKSKRIACLNNFRQIGIGMSIYALENQDRVLEARDTAVQVAINPPHE
jgi:hypothetical protein